jgi:hypothetical protein
MCGGWHEKRRRIAKIVRETTAVGLWSAAELAQVRRE